MADEINFSLVYSMAADVIEERGWCRGWFTNDTGQVCAAGALAVACGLEPEPARSPRVWQEGPGAQDWSRAWDALDAYLGVQVIRWNDEPERTDADVVRLLRAAANHEPVPDGVS